MPVINSVQQNTPTDVSLTKFAKRSFLLISSSVIRLGAQLAIVFLYSRNLSVAEYGLYQSIWLYINVVSVISLFGLPSIILSSSVSSIRLWINKNKKKFIFLSLLLNITPSLYVLLAANEYNHTIKLLLLILIIIQNISIITETIVIKKKKEKIVLLSNLIFSTGYLICHLIILYYNYSLISILTTLVLMFIIKTVILWIFAMQNVTALPSKTVKPLGNQWLYLGLYDVLSVVFKWVDKWVILFFISASQFAVYFNGSYEIPLFGLMISAVGSIMLVDLSGQNDNATKVKSLFKNSSKLLASIVFPSFCFLFFYNQDFFTLIFSVKYIAAIPIFTISIFILPLRITNFTAALQVYNRNDLIVKGAVLDLIIAVVLMAILYPILKLQGLALAFVLSTYVQAGYYLWHTGKLINKKISYFFPFKKLFFIMTSSAIITGLSYYLFLFFTYPLNIISGIIVCIILITTYLFLNHNLAKKSMQ
jgi:O-antigen/teichoic acid export membrane protein